MQTISIKDHEYQELILSPSSTLCTDSPALISPEVPSFPRLQIDSLDTSPFSSSFSGLIEEVLDTSISDSKSDNANTSYVIQCITKNSEFDIEWDNQDVDEILILRPKAASKLSTIEEETQSSDSIEFPGLGEFEPIPEEPESNGRARLYRKRNDGQIYTVKVFRNRVKPSIERLTFDIVENLKAPFLPQVYRSFCDADYFFIVTEYHSRESLQDLIRSRGSFIAEQALFYASELIHAVISLHDAGIIHRNLKPENIIINTAGHIIVEGLEYSKLICSLPKGGDLDKRLCNKPVTPISSFSAPEILLNWAHEFSVDCWAFGMLLSFMLSGKLLFSDCHPSTDAWKDLVVHEPVELSCILNFTARDLVAKCLERNPAVRLNVSGIKSHAYFSSVDWKNVAAKRVQAPLWCNPPMSASGAYVTSNVFPSEAAPTLSVESRHSTTSGFEGINEAVSNSESKRAVHASLDNERPRILSRLFRTSSLLESSPKATKSNTPDRNVPSIPSLTDSFSNNLRHDPSASEKMAAFWRTLDLAETSASTPALRGNAVSRPHKLRKSRSLFYPGKVSSNASTLSLHDKLFKKYRLTNTSSPSVISRPAPFAVDLPNGVKQIGSGIGFTYNTPAAALSKVSICTDIPKGCSGILPQRLLNLRFRSRSPSALAKAKAKRILFNLLVSDSDHGASPDDVELGPDPPLLSEILDIEAESPYPGIQSCSSPVSKPVQVAPLKSLDDESGNFSLNTEFHEDAAREAKVGDTETTLRLVTPSEVNEE